MRATKQSGFKKGSGCYTCESCGKRTRETGGCESNSGICLACYDAGGLENEHSDFGHPEPVEGCPTCEGEKGARFQIVTVQGDGWRRYSVVDTSSIVKGKPLVIAWLLSLPAALNMANGRNRRAAEGQDKA